LFRQPIDRNQPTGGNFVSDKQHLSFNTLFLIVLGIVALAFLKSFFLPDIPWLELLDGFSLIQG